MRKILTVSPDYLVRSCLDGYDPHSMREYRFDPTAESGGGSAGFPEYGPTSSEQVESRESIVRERPREEAENGSREGEEATGTRLLASPLRARPLVRERLRSRLDYHAGLGFTNFVDKWGHEWLSLGPANAVRETDFPREVRAHSARERYIVGLSLDDQLLVKLTPYMDEPDAPPDPPTCSEDVLDGKWVPAWELVEEPKYHASGRLCVFNLPEPSWGQANGNNSCGAPNTSICSATLCGSRRLIVTAAHCWRRQGAWQGRYGWFYPAMNKVFPSVNPFIDNFVNLGQPMGQYTLDNLVNTTPFPSAPSMSRAKAPWRVFGATFDFNYWKGEEAWNDFAWAFLEETSPAVLSKLPQPRPYAYHSASYMNGRSLNSFSYPDAVGTSTRGSITMRSETCKVGSGVKLTYARGFYHTCPRWGGASGGGMLHPNGTTSRELWGVHVGTRNGVPYASRVTKDRRAMLNDAVSEAESGGGGFP